MDVAITAPLPKYGRKAESLPKSLIKGKICSVCHFIHPVRPLFIKHHRKMAWTIRSSMDRNRFNPSSGAASNNSRGPRLIKAIQDLRTKLIIKIQEIKKDLPMKVFFLLVGFYSATAFSTVIGQTGDWDVLSAALAVFVVECIGALMYKASIPLINKIRSLITMFNYWKTGLALGLFLDSFKF